MRESMTGDLLCADVTWISPAAGRRRPGFWAIEVLKRYRNARAGSLGFFPANRRHRSAWETWHGWRVDETSVDPEQTAREAKSGPSRGRAGVWRHGSSAGFV